MLFQTQQQYQFQQQQQQQPPKPQTPEYEGVCHNDYIIRDTTRPQFIHLLPMQILYFPDPRSRYYVYLAKSNQDSRYYKASATSNPLERL